MICFSQLENVVFFCFPLKFHPIRSDNVVSRGQKEAKAMFDTFAVAVLFILVEIASGVRFFTQTYPLIVVLLFSLWGLSQISFAYFLSAFVKRTRTATSTTKPSTNWPPGIRAAPARMAAQGARPKRWRASSICASLPEKASSGP